MRILTGDDTGLVKVWDIEKSEYLMKMGEQEINNGVEHLIFYNDNDEDKIVTCSKNTTLNLYELDYEQKKETLYSSYQIDDSETRQVVGLSKLRNTNKLLYTFDNNKTYTIDYDLEEGNFTDIVSIYTPENQKQVEKTILNKTQQKLLVLSKGTNPQLIDIEGKSQIWKARNVKNDWLDLQVPIWDIDGAFFNNDKNIYSVTAYQQIRTYDLLKKNSQPIADVQINEKLLKEKSPFTSMVMSHCENYMYISNKMGSTFQFDIRKDFNMVGKLKGSASSIRQVKMHPTLPYTATASIDRYCRVYNEKNKLVGKSNMGQRLNCLLFSNKGLEDQEEFEENATEVHQNASYKEENKKTQQDHRENKKRFVDLKKHSIKLGYLQEKMDNDEIKRQKLKEKQRKLEEQKRQEQMEQEQQDQEEEEEHEDGAQELGKYLEEHEDDEDDSDDEIIDEDDSEDDMEDDDSDDDIEDDQSDDQDDQFKYVDDSDEEEDKQKSKKAPQKKKIQKQQQQQQQRQNKQQQQQKNKNNNNQKKQFKGKRK